MTPLLPPQSIPQLDTPDRNQWITNICANFVSKSGANKEYYRVILEFLWPIGHGIPGPQRTTDEIRTAINDYRASKNQGDYHDPFRRLRELQGEEGLIGIVSIGKYRQLQHLQLEAKRIPRTGLSDTNWQSILQKTNYQCTVCHRDTSLIRLQQDHRIPRLRGGGDDIENWQPLCDECNNFKSTMCRGCIQNCSICPWAFPEQNPRILINHDLLQQIILQAKIQKCSPSDLVNRLLNQALCP